MTHFRVIADFPFGVDYVVRYYGNLNIFCSSIALGYTVSEINSALPHWLSETLRICR